MAEVFLTGQALITAAGAGVEANYRAFREGRRCFSLPTHFDARGIPQGVIHFLDSGTGSRAFRLVDLLAKELSVPEAPLFLATTVGAIDLLEGGKRCDCNQELLQYAVRRFGAPRGELVSAACASGQIAIACAAQTLLAGKSDFAIVLGIDIVSEFVTSGFASLGALSPSGVCLPYDDSRDGLLLGEAAGIVVLSTKGGSCRIAGWGESSDAAHATAPEPSGRYLALAGDRALAMSPEKIGEIIGHGTGTRYNDAAELAAFRSLFGDSMPPLSSVKGVWGHTLGATGVLQCIMATELAKEKKRVMTVNAGFGGVNSVLIVEAAE